MAVENIQSVSLIVPGNGGDFQLLVSGLKVEHFEQFSQYQIPFINRYGGACLPQFVDWFKIRGYRATLRVAPQSISWIEYARQWYRLFVLRVAWRLWGSRIYSSFDQDS